MIDTLSKGQITHVGLVFGLIITVMIYSLGHVSGAHFNPAVTLGFVLAQHFPVDDPPPGSVLPFVRRSHLHLSPD